MGCAGNSDGRRGGDGDFAVRIEWGLQLDGIVPTADAKAATRAPSEIDRGTGLAPLDGRRCSVWRRRL